MGFSSELSVRSGVSAIPYTLVDEEKTKLKVLSKKLGVQNKIKYFGFRKDIKPVLKSSNLYISPSYFEEMKGLAKGANLTIEEAALCQLRAEAVHKIDGGCTAFAIKGDATVDGNVIAGQNQDLSSEYTDITCLLYTSDAPDE